MLMHISGEILMQYHFPHNPGRNVFTQLCTWKEAILHSWIWLIDLRLTLPSPQNFTECRRRRLRHAVYGPVNWTPGRNSEERTCSTTSTPLHEMSLVSVCWRVSSAAGLKGGWISPRSKHPHASATVQKNLVLSETCRCRFFVIIF